MSVPAPPVPAGQATHPDRAWACDYLSALLGRPVTGGLNVDRLAAKLAQERATPVPAPRPGWQTTLVRGGITR